MKENKPFDRIRLSRSAVENLVVFRRVGAGRNLTIVTRGS